MVLISLRPISRFIPISMASTAVMDEGLFDEDSLNTDPDTLDLLIGIADAFGIDDSDLTDNSDTTASSDNAK